MDCVTETHLINVIVPDMSVDAVLNQLGNRSLYLVARCESGNLLIDAIFVCAKCGQNIASCRLNFPSCLFVEFDFCSE
jgi:hypothetical protein